MSETPDAEQSYWDLIEPIWDRVNIYDGVAEYTRSITEIPRPLLLLYAAHFCLSELRNGGFLQLFRNSTGVLVPESIEGFQEVGMPHLADVVRTAAAKLGPEYPRDRAARWHALQAASGVSEDAIHEPHTETKEEYRSFLRATAPLGFYAMEERAWKLAEEENGGFEAAADRYAATVHRPN